MEIGKAFTYLFDDENWVSVLLIGALIGVGLFIPIVNIAAALLFAGFMLETARNVMHGHERPLPKWDNFGEKLRLGFIGTVINLVYSLPLIILAVVASCVLLLPAISTDNEEVIVGAALSLAFCVMPLALIGGLVVLPFAFGAVGRFLRTDSLSSAFEFSAVIAEVRGNIGPWIVLVLLSFLCGIIGSLGSSVFLIGMLFTYPYSQAVFGHIFGQHLRMYAPNSAPASYDPPVSPYGG